MNIEGLSCSKKLSVCSHMALPYIFVLSGGAVTFKNRMKMIFLLLLLRGFEVVRMRLLTGATEPRTYRDYSSCLHHD